MGRVQGWEGGEMYTRFSGREEDKRARVKADSFDRQACLSVHGGNGCNVGQGDIFRYASPNRDQ